MGGCMGGCNKLGSALCRLLKQSDRKSQNKRGICGHTDLALDKGADAAMAAIVDDLDVEDLGVGEK